MSARSALGPICRALSSNVRASPIAGPSRIPFIPLRRSLQTDADPSTPKGLSEQPHLINTSKLVVRTSQPLTSVLQAYAILRSIESSYGQVIDFDMLRDADSLLPGNTLFFTMAEPVNLGKEKEALHEIPSPRSSAGVMERYGGPSLEDIRGILRDPSTQLSTSTRGKTLRESITFKVEIRRKSGNSPPLPIKKANSKSVEQDRKLLKALGKFGDGFFGGFKGLGEKHTTLLEEKALNVKPQGKSGKGVKGGETAVKAELAGDATEGKASEAQAAVPDEKA